MKAVSLLALTLALVPVAVRAAPAAAPVPADTAPTNAAAADRFIADAERRTFAATNIAQQTMWINETFITDDTDAVAARAQADLTRLGVTLAKQAVAYQQAPDLSFDTRRKLDILRDALTLPAPSTPGAADELSTISTKLAGLYGKGRGTLAGQPIGGSDIEDKMHEVRDPAQLKEMWTSWHDNVGTPMRADYTRLVALTNQGARELGYADAGAMWRSGYDMPPAEFAALVDRLWEQVKPLYVELHCYVRGRLNARYGDAVQKDEGPIRADLLANMWAQEWGNLYDVVAPPGAGDIGYSTTDLLVSHGYDPVKMVKTAEAFYTSLGFQPLPETFWQRSMFVKPRDREVICHASAWDIDSRDDLRIKTCLKVNATDFQTVHHELGHNFYQRAYKDQPPLYQNGANDGFHEAIGDFIALAVTPDYLVQKGLLDPAKVPSADKDVGLLLRQAMDKVAFLPFGLLVDKWRWGVFDGSIKPADYETAWNRLRLDYQGVVPPVARPADAFDPGAKFHVASSTPYMRYFLARILQFQFYQAACAQAGWTGPLHRCTFYGNKAVGEKLNAMLTMGMSKPWPDALQAFTGRREMDGAAMIAYFRPLMTWLQQQNKGRTCGW